MIDNLQIHYLQRLDHSLKRALHGQLGAGLDILFELRLVPTLSLYVRAMVNLALHDLTTIERFPDRAKFAEEALRIVRELQTDPGPERDAYWTDAYNRMAEEAEKKATEAAAETQNRYATLASEDRKEVEAPKSKAIPVGHVRLRPAGRLDDDQVVEKTFSLRMPGVPPSPTGSDVNMSDDTIRSLPHIPKKSYILGNPSHSSQDSGYHSMSGHET